MEQSNIEKNIGQLCKAMAEAFPEIRKALADKSNPYFNSTYADLESYIDAIKPALVAHGLWFLQKVHPMDNHAAIETIILHHSGESLSCGITAVPVTKKDAQGFGATMTYARRFSLSTAFGVATGEDVGAVDKDDDGNTACGKNQTGEVSESGSLEPRNLGTEELKELSKRVGKELGIDYGVVLDCLTSWQAKKPIQPMIDGLLATDRGALSKSIKKWEEKNLKK